MLAVTARLLKETQLLHKKRTGEYKLDFNALAPTACYGCK